MRNYSKGIFSSNPTCHTEIHLSNNLSTDVLIFSILENYHIISIPACVLPATNCILSALSDVCIQTEMLRFAMHGQRHVYLNISHPQRFITTFHFI